MRTAKMIWLILWGMLAWIPVILYCALQTIAYLDIKAFRDNLKAFIK